MKGLVLWGTNNLFSVLAEDGMRRLCALKGKRLKGQDGAYNAIAAGDIVEIALDGAAPERGMILTLLARRNVFGRFNEKGRAVQAIAANVDIVVCVASVALPPFRPRFIDRVSVLAEAATVPLLIVINKADLGLPEAIEERLANYAALGYEGLVASAVSGTGIAALRERLEGKTSVFAGQSGVGKSSLLNAIEPGLGRKVDAVSEKYARGKHTTTRAELSLLSDGSTKVIDTPGVRRLALRGIDPDRLDAYFPELAPLAPRCEFGLSCTHTDEQGCRITRSVDDGLILADRFESYLRIREELAATAGYKPREGRNVASRSRGNGVRRSQRAAGMRPHAARDGDADDE